MFGRKKNPEPDGPYRVEKVVGGNKLLQKLLNERHAEGYDLVWILQQQVVDINNKNALLIEKAGFSRSVCRVQNRVCTDSL